LYCIQVIVLFRSILPYIYMVMLPKLNRRNGWPIAMFQTLLIAHARSGLREQQLVMSHLFQFFWGWGVWYLKCYWENWLQVFRTFLIIFGLCIYLNLSSQKKKNFLFYAKQKWILYCTVFFISYFHSWYLCKKKMAKFSFFEPP
jgi:hypothetical protein